jgi:deoxyribose-phosphate aldolase
MNPKEIFSFLDLTTLNATDNEETVGKILDFAIQSKNEGYRAAAVCVYAEFSQLIKNRLQNTGIQSAVVAGAFSTWFSNIEK